MVPDMLHRSIHMDESHHPLDNEHDSGGSRAKTYTDPRLNRNGSRSTRSHSHCTGVYSVNLANEICPPMYIFSSKAASLQVKDEWVLTLGDVRGKWGHSQYINLPSMVASRNEGSMDADLFIDYIDEVEFMQSIDIFIIATNLFE